MVIQNVTLFLTTFLTPYIYSTTYINFFYLTFKFNSIMKSYNFSIAVYTIVTLMVITLVTMFAYQYADMAKTHALPFRNSANDGKIIFISLTIFSGLFIVTCIGEFISNRRKA